jgi:hypothetical protein
MKRILSIVFFLILLGALVFGLYLARPEWFPFGERVAVQTLTFEEEKTYQSAPPKEVTETGEYYDIEASYPSGTPLSEKVSPMANERAVTTLRSFIDGEIRRFKENGNFESLSETDIAMLGYEDGRKQALQISYEEYLSSHTVSYVFTLYQDTLGAHGNTFFRTFVFDLSTGEGRILRDVFQAESAFLETISQLSRNALIASLGESADTGMIDQGTTPYEDNFQAWYLDGDAFVILFPPYQVAPYSAGRQKVEIPLSELASVLK